MDQITPNQNQDLRPKPRYTVWIIIGIIAVVVAIGIGIYFFCQPKSNSNTSTPTNNSNQTSNQTFSDYRNSKVGFTTQVPSSLKPSEGSTESNRVDFSKESSEPSEGGQTGAFTFAEIWYENSTQTPKEAIEEAKATAQKFPIKDFKVISEENITIDGQPGVKAVWSYADIQTNSATISANAYAAKAGKMWKINYTVGSATAQETQSTWNESSYLFEKMISAFQFL